MIPTTELIKTVVEDLHYIKDEWGQNIDDAHLRRGSTTLRRLLVDGELQRAWKAAGFAKEPIIPTATLSFIKQFPEDQILLACAGGGRFGGNEARQIHVLKARPEKPLEGDPIDELLPLRSFVDSPCMVIHGWHVPRRTVVKFVANKLGGSHSDGKPDKPDLAKLYRALDWARTTIGFMDKDSGFYELLSCGQALGRSEDLSKLMNLGK